MKKTIILGTAALVAINMIAGAAYSFVWPYLDDLNLISWDWDMRLLGEFSVYTIIIAMLSWLFCRWFERRIEKDIKEKNNWAFL